MSETVEQLKVLEKMAEDTGNWKTFPLSRDTWSQQVVNECTEHNMNLIKEARIKLQNKQTIWQHSTHHRERTL